MLTRNIAIAAAMLLASATAAQAAEQPADQPNPNWHFTATPYVWASNLKGDMRVCCDVEPIDVDLSFGKIFDHLKFVAMGSFEARKDRLIFFADLGYVHLGASSGLNITDLDLVDAELDATTFTATMLGGYRVAQGSVDVDLFAGGRLVVADTDLVLSGPRRTVEGDVTKTWLDPIVAVRVTVPVGPRTGIALYGDVGGFGIASNSTWQLASEPSSSG